nr:MAG TPA_asm: hypothetical protein [Caudoviricetes sp.]
MKYTNVVIPKHINSVAIIPVTVIVTIYTPLKI